MATDREANAGPLSRVAAWSELEFAQPTRAAGILHVYLFSGNQCALGNGLTRRSANYNAVHNLRELGLIISIAVSMQMLRGLQKAKRTFADVL